MSFHGWSSDPKTDCELQSKYGDAPSRKAIRIDSTKPFMVNLDLTGYVKKVANGYACAKCDKVLVMIESGGIFGEKLNQLDTTVILDHHLAEHNE